MTPKQSTSRKSTPSKFLWHVGTLALVVAMAASALLCLRHFGAIALPGCGAGSPCDAAAKSAFGSVPGSGWPVSFVGLAYFAGLLAAWLAGGGRWSKGLLCVAIAGGVGSVVFAGAAVALKVPCVYCFVVHAANLVFVGAACLVISRSGNRRSWQPLVATTVGIAAMVALVVADGAANAKAQAKAEAELAASMKQIESGTGEKEPVEVIPFTQPDEPVATAPIPLAGRYRWGPATASVRIVLFTDYQCPDCKNIESELEALMNDKTLSLSVSARHFPLSTDCNPNAPDNRHGNACWAARAAETAGQMGGSDAYYQMHKWLFSRSGSFNDREIQVQAASMGFDPQVFNRLMQTQATLDPVKADIETAMSLGIYQTPFIFINGVELRGWNAKNALTRAARAAAASAPATNALDVPPPAAMKLVDDWRHMPQRAIPDSLKVYPLGPTDAEVEVVMWGDYQEPFTAEADGILRLFTRGVRPNIRYTFLQFPVDQSCNPVTQVTAQPLACRAAKAAKAAEALAGGDGFWLMHDRLMMNQNGLTDAVLEGVAIELGLEPTDLFEAMDQPFVVEAIAADARAAQQLGVQSIPMLFIGGKLVPRWKADHENILPRLIDAAASQ